MKSGSGPQKTILDFIDEVLGPEGFMKGSQEDWLAWRTFLACLFGLTDQFTPEMMELYAHHTGRTKLPTPGLMAEEGWLIVGRRGGKSHIVSIIAVYLACFFDYSEYLAPGERATVMIIAADRKQSRVIMRYIKAMIKGVPMLAGMEERFTSEVVDLTNRVTIEVHTASFRSVRGYTLIAALCDEIAFWRSDEAGATPDREILGAIRPAMATIPNAMLFGLSSPHIKKGVLWEAYRDHYGEAASEDSVFVWKAATREMNPSIPQEFIDAEYRKDPSWAAAEYGGEFRNDLEMFLDADLIARVVDHDRPLELPPRTGIDYVAFVDPSGGRGDAFTIGIAHMEEYGRYVLDLLRETRPPFDPDTVVEEYVRIIADYHCSKVTGDHYSAGWVSNAFDKRGISYFPTERTKSQIYLEALPLFTRESIELPHMPRLTNELCQLERRRARGGRDTVDHPPRGHDDLANAGMGALVELAILPDVTGVRAEDYVIGPPSAASIEFEEYGAGVLDSMGPLEVF